MSRFISVKTKLLQKRGSGTGADYKPWIYIREMNSMGEATALVDWKHGRAAQLLSKGEVYLYRILRFNDNVEDIREQFPLLPVTDTEEIAEKFGINHPYSPKEKCSLPLTTDLLVTLKSGELVAYSVKASRQEVEGEAHRRTREKLVLEKTYWDLKGVKWYLKYTDNLNRIYAENIKRVCQYYDPKLVNKHPVTEREKVDYIKYLIAHKYLKVDMKSELLDWNELVNIYMRKDG